MKYRIELSESAIDDLERLGKRVRQRIVAHLEALSDAPHPPGAAFLKGPLSGYVKLRVGDQRIIYLIETEVIYVVRIGHRRGIYKELARL